MQSQRKIVGLAAIAVLIGCATGPLETPVAGLVAVSNGEDGVDLSLNVANWRQYRDGLFRPHPGTPACAHQDRGSRIWVSIVDDFGPLQSHCALSSGADLAQLQLNLPGLGSRPERIRLELWDWQHHVGYASGWLEVPDEAPVVDAAQLEPAVATPDAR